MMVVGDYEYDKKNKIGQGSFGKVYKGHEKPVQSITSRYYYSSQLRFVINIPRPNVHRKCEL